MTVEIKILGPGDEALLARVADDVFDDAVDVQATATFLNDPRHHIAVATDEGVVVGFASGVHYLHPDKPRPELFVNEVGVAESHRGRGLGKAVLAALLDHGQTLGCAQAWVLTSRDNTPARRLYAAAGGAIVEDDTVLFEFALGDAPR
jgi:ribosomal protein S18 acetylase RimI-like enzyme